MTILDRIRSYKLQEVAAGKRERPLPDLEADARTAPPVRHFTANLRHAAANGYALIAEIKRASPSKGLIRSDFDPASHARAYEAGGAACLSVLTDGPSFQGALQHLKDARAATSLPVLRKDFMYDPWQVAEARAMGADCILIIMASVSDAEAGELEAAATQLGMDALIEVHNAHEIERALRLRSPLIGINNRDLHTFETTLETTRALAASVPEDRIVISESGLFAHNDLASLARIGVRAFLIGESLMRQADLEAATRALLADPVASMTGLTHFDEQGAARMVDVSGKPVTDRTAIARGAVRMAPETLFRITEGSASKGDVLAVARLAGIMGAKRTADLIPLCHPIALTKVSLDLEAEPQTSRVIIEAVVRTSGQTGVEMEALTAVSVAALTVYDMLKSVDRSMVIEEVRLALKDGGKSGRYEAS